MRKPYLDADRDIFEGMADAREERIAHRARLMKKTCGSERRAKCKIAAQKVGPRRLLENEKA